MSLADLSTEDSSTTTENSSPTTVMVLSAVTVNGTDDNDGKYFLKI